MMNITRGIKSPIIIFIGAIKIFENEMSSRLDIAIHIASKY